MNTRTKNRVFFSAMLVVTALIIASVLSVAGPYLETRYRPLVVQYIAATLPPEERKAIYTQISKQTESAWETVPEPLVGRIAKAGLDTSMSYAQVRTNNAGMRDNRPYLKKDPATYRIICLGDSFVFGEAGKQEDRWCDQIQQWFVDTGTRIAGKPVETLALGLSSWTMLQEASYLSSRISEYDPDLIIVMTVSNDLTTDAGVNGAGLVTNDFSNSQRHRGSGIFTISAGKDFGVQRYGSLYYEQSPAALGFWATGMAAMERLGELQQNRHKDILFSVLNEAGIDTNYFENAYRYHFQNSGITADHITVTYLKSHKTVLPHDAHPNRDGHTLLANQYLHALAKKGIITDHIDQLPTLTAELVPAFNLAPDLALLETQRRNFSNRVARSFDFAEVTPNMADAFLGGILPDMLTPRATPWASVHAGFLIKPPEEGQPRFALVIDIPDKPELFPLHITLTIDARLEKTFTFSRAGKETLLLDIPPDLAARPVLEIVTDADHYFTGIEDHRMKVFRLVSAGWN